MEKKEGKDRNGEKSFSKVRPLVAAIGISLAISCGYEGNGVRQDGGSGDGGMGGDGGMLNDGGMGGDGGMNDGGMGGDGGMGDGGMGGDGGAPCSLVNTPSAVYVFPIGNDVPIGGAAFRYVSNDTASTLTWDTRCAADSSTIEVGASLTVGMNHTIPHNGFTISITVNSKNAANASATVGIQ